MQTFPNLTKVVVTNNANIDPIELFSSLALDYLVIKHKGTQTNTSGLRIAGSFLSNPGTVLGKPSVLPRELPEGLVWLPSPSLNSGDWSDADIDRIPELTRWKADFHLNDGAIVTQYYETTVAPLTIPEIKRFRWARLSEQTYSEFVSKSYGSGNIPFEEGFSSYPVAWTVPAEAYAPSKILIQGWWNRYLFNDGLDVLPADKQVTVDCSPQSDLDKHCVQPSQVSSIGLFATNSRDMLIASNYWSYKFLF